MTQDIPIWLTMDEVLARVEKEPPLKSVQDLCKALEGGNYDGGSLVNGAPLVVESLEAVMKCVVFYGTEQPDRFVDGVSRPILAVWGRYYEFAWTPKGWVQTPGSIVFQDRSRLVLKPHGKPRLIRTERKRLTPLQLRHVNRRMKRFMKRHGPPADLTSTPDPV